MGAIDQLAADFNNTKPLGQRRPFDQFGRYLQKIQKVTVAKSFHKGGDYCAIEKRVVKMLEAPPAVGEGGVPFQVNHVGQEIVDMINNFGPQAKVYNAKCRGFVSTMFGATFDETTWDDFQLVIGPLQPLAGWLCEIDNSPRMIKITQGPKAGQQENRPNKAYVRGYSPKEIPSVLTPDEIAKFYPNGELDRLIKAQLAQEAGGAPA